MTEILHSSLFYQLATLLLMAGILGFIAMKLKQPLLIAFIVLGLLSGPAALNIVGGENHLIEILAELGITLLLFMVGLKLDIGLIKKLGVAALATGVAQVFLTAILGGALTYAIGYDMQTAVLSGVALAFSSTIIVVKLLSDKRAIDSLYGKMALGILIVQDIAVIMALVALAAFGKTESAEHYDPYTMIAVKVLVLIVLTGLFVRFIAQPLTHSLSRAPELMMIFALGMATIMAAICYHMGLSKELGGLLAGVALASTPYHNVISAKLSSLRDFLLLFFFVNLGLHMDFSDIEAQIVPALIFSLFVLFLKPAIIMGVMTLSGYRRRTGFMTGISLGQISEFSLIFMAMAVSSELAPEGIRATFTLTGLITIALSCYAITYSNALQGFFEKFTPLLTEKSNKIYGDEDTAAYREDSDIIIFGLGRYGTAMALQFQGRGKRVLGIDFDPAAVRNAKEIDIPAMYGDASDPDFLEHLPLDKAHVIVLAFHHYYTGPLITDLRRTLAKLLREHGYKGHIAATSHHPEHDRDLTDHGIDTVLTPYDDAALHGAYHIINMLARDKTDKA